MKVIFFQGKYRKFVKIRKGEQLSPVHFDEEVKHPQKEMYWGSFNFYGVGSFMPTEAMMNSHKDIDVI